jgi:hypothetical protein
MNLTEGDISMGKKFKSALKTTVSAVVVGFLLYSALIAMLALGSGARVFRYQGF